MLIQSSKFVIVDDEIMKYDRPVNRTCLQEKVKSNLDLSILKQRFLITADYKTHNKLDFA